MTSVHQVCYVKQQGRTAKRGPSTACDGPEHHTWGFVLELGSSVLLLERNAASSQIEGWPRVTLSLHLDTGLVPTWTVEVLGGVSMASDEEHLSRGWISNASVSQCQGQA